MAALASQSITVGHAHIMVASRTGIELARVAVFFAAQLEAEPPPAERPSFSSISLIQAGQDSLRSGPALNKTNSDSDKDAAIIPIDAQPPGTNGFGRAAGRYDREDFRPSSIGRTRSGLREPPRP
jgi:hypothetical protein